MFINSVPQASYWTRSKLSLPAEKLLAKALKHDEHTKRGNVQSSRRHEVVFCSGESVLLESFAGFIVAAQQAGNPAIVIATKSHLDDIVYRLRAQNVFVEQAIETGRFVPLDVSEVLSGFMVDDMPDPVRFFKN